MRLIDANLLKAEFTGNFVDSYVPAHIKAIIDTAPTIEYPPIIRAKWETVTYEGDGSEIIVCSNCKTNQENEIQPGWMFCPYCGAKINED